MRAILKHEVYKILHSNTYRLIFSLLILYSIYASVVSLIVFAGRQTMMAEYPRDAAGYFTSSPAMAHETLFAYWLGGKMGYDFSATVFFYLLPIVTTIPYGLSCYAEIKSGYLRNLAVRTKKSSCMLAKFCAAFFSGFSLIFSALVLNILILAAFIPAYTPDPTQSSTYGTMPEQFLVSLFYQRPFVYMLTYLLISCIFAGLWATVPLALSLVTRNRFIVIFAPFILLLFITNVFDLLFAYQPFVELSPFFFLRGTVVRDPVNLVPILIWSSAIFIFTFGTTMLKGVRDDVF